METSNVRQRLQQTIERARRSAGERRARNDEATRAFNDFLDHVAVPLFKQIANVLKIENYPFTVFTPAGNVRLMSDRSADDYIELALDTSDAEPRVMAHISHSRGRRVVDAEQVVGSGRPETLTEEDLFAFLLKELEPFVER
ncbi:MAG: hypothetical protein AUH43_11560 [Acidobacteria bacterium 13_1_40CM_65_14]|jgi:hypothetical protein|nr:MAG: hypothetical protein AUH43_11560 [Acidobacteria bacterium 13_1_40CM_65_14]